MTFESTLEWQRQCLEDLRADELSLEGLARKYRRSPSTIVKLQRLSGLSGTRKAKTLRSCRDGDPISRSHRRVGVRLTLLRGERSVSTISELLGISHLRLRRKEVGQHDFTLSELEHISECLGEPLLELLAEAPQLKVC